MQKHSRFQLRVFWKIRHSPYLPLFPFLFQMSYDRSAVGDITAAGSYVRNLCWLHPLRFSSLKASSGQKSERCPRGQGWGVALQGKNIWPMFVCSCNSDMTVPILISAWGDIYHLLFVLIRESRLCACESLLFKKILNPHEFETHRCQELNTWQISSCGAAKSGSQGCSAILSLLWKITFFVQFKGRSGCFAEAVGFESIKGKKLFELFDLNTIHIYH